MFLELFLNLIISTLLSELLKPKQSYTAPTAATISDFTFPTASEDRAIPVLWGTRKQTSTNSLWQGDFVARPITEKIRTSLFSSQTITEGYNYYVGMQLGLCIGDVDEVVAIWCGDECVFQSTAGQSTIGVPLPVLGLWQDGNSTSGCSGTMIVHSSDETPDAYLQTQLTATKTTTIDVPPTVANPNPSATPTTETTASMVCNPAYPHMTYAVFAGPSAASGTPQVLGLLSPTGGKGNGWVGSSTAIRPFDFVLRRYPKVAQYGIPQATVSQYAQLGVNDANIAWCMLELLCNVEWGAGVPPQLVDLDSFISAATTLYSEGNGLSLLWDSESACSDIATELMKQANGCLYTNLNTGLITFHLVRAGDVAKLALTDDNITQMTSFTRAGTDESSNCIRLSFEDAGNNFINRVAQAQDLGAVEMSGQIIASTVSYPGISDAGLAPTIAMRDLRASTASLSKFQLKCALPVGTVLHPGDLVTLSFSPNGISNLSVRVVSASYADATKGECDLTLVEDIFLPGVNTYSASLPPLPTTGNQPAPGYPAWENASFIAPYPYNPTPSSPVGMYFCGAPNPNPQAAFGYCLGFFDNQTTRNSSTAAWFDGNTAFAAWIRNTDPMPVVSGQPVIGYSTVGAADDYTIARNAGAQTLAMTDGGELLVVSCTNGQMTIVERGAYGTQPYPLLPGRNIYLLYGFVVDPAPLVVGPSSYGSGWANILQPSYVRPQTFGPGGYGPFDTISQSGDKGGISGANATVSASALPYAPGNVSIGGSPLVPISSSSWDASFMSQLPSSTLNTVSFVGRNRLVTSAVQGYFSGAGLESGATVSATVQYCPAANYTPGTAALKSLATTYNATSGSFTITDTIPTGQALVMQVSLQVVSPTGGSAFYTYAWLRPAS